MDVEMLSMTTHHKKGSSAQESVQISSNRNAFGLCLFVGNAVRNSIQSLGIYFKKTVVAFVVADTEEKEEHLQYQRQETHKDWWHITLNEASWLGLVFVRVVGLVARELKQHITTIVNHLESGGFVVRVIVSGIRPNQNTQPNQLLSRKRYSKFIVKEPEWITETPVIRKIT